ncbi:MAG: AAA family ATPase [Planctomycetota bacterium]
MKSPKGAQLFRGRTPGEAMVAAKAALGQDSILLEQRTVVEIAASLPGAEAKARRFVASTRAEALSAVRCAMGAEAVLLEERSLVELVAAPALQESEAPMPSGGNRLLKKTYGLAVPGEAAASPSAAREGRPAAAGAPQHTRPAGGLPPSVLTEIHEQLEEIRRLARQSDRPMVGEALLDLYLAMLDNEVSEEVARHLVERLNEEVDPALRNDPAAVREAMREAIARLIPVGGPIRLRGDGRPTVVAIVGPTGVGKTTSIAKLAMQFKVHHRYRVGLISEDTSRPGGGEQLRSVAQLLNIPLVVADTVDRVREAIARFRDREVILVDTAGRVPRNGAAVEELAAFLDEIDPDEVHLALCSLTSQKQVLDTVRRFDAVRFDRILLTKLDEAATHGLILNVAAHIDRGLSYVTTGQDYMEHIEPGDARRLASLVLGAALEPPAAPEA